ncbi:MAG: hypothetical protein ACKV2T_19080 [Kofleriaceae bacterium]
MYLHTDDDEATVIDHGPHWSARPLTTLPRPVQRSAAQPPVVNARVTSLVRDPVPGPYLLPRTFYSHAEEQASRALDTECVAPLPMSELRPDWQIWFAAKWARYAVPFCGAAAGLLLIISYLLLGGESRAVAAAATKPTSSAIVMRVDGPAPTNRDAAVRQAIAMARSGAMTPSDPPAEMVDIEEAATTGTIVAAEPDEIEMDAIPMQRPAKHVVVKHGKRKSSSGASAKRGPIKLNAKTALGDLRVSRSR